MGTKGYVSRDRMAPAPEEMAPEVALAVRQLLALREQIDIMLAMYGLGPYRRRREQEAPGPDPMNPAVFGQKLREDADE
jgi:hypothetical protein